MFWSNSNETCRLRALNIYEIAATPCAIIGDINVKVNHLDDPETMKYLELLATHGLIQLVNKPTHQSGNTLDHIICQSSGNLQLTFTVNPLKRISDNFPVFFQLPWIINASAKGPSLKRIVRKFMNTNIASSQTFNINRSFRGY
jgi:hypothetical protein